MYASCIRVLSSQGPDDAHERGRAMKYLEKFSSARTYRTPFFELKQSHLEGQAGFTFIRSNYGSLDQLEQPLCSPDTQKWLEQKHIQLAPRLHLTNPQTSVTIEKPDWVKPIFEHDPHASLPRALRSTLSALKIDASLGLGDIVWLLKRMRIAHRPHLTELDLCLSDIRRPDLHSFFRLIQSSQIRRLSLIHNSSSPLDGYCVKFTEFFLFQWPDLPRVEDIQITLGLRVGAGAEHMDADAYRGWQGFRNQQQRYWTPKTLNITLWFVDGNGRHVLISGPEVLRTMLSMSTVAKVLDDWVGHSCDISISLAKPQLLHPSLLEMIEQTLNVTLQSELHLIRTNEPTSIGWRRNGKARRDTNQAGPSRPGRIVELGRADRQAREELYSRAQVSPSHGQSAIPDNRTAPREEKPRMTET